MLIGDALEWGENALLKAEIENARMEASWLILSHVKSLKSPNDLWLKKKESFSRKSWCQYQNQIGQRLKKVPLAYILGFQEFMGLRFLVNPDVLIPRQETEIMVEEILKRISILSKIPKILDVGTGSGNIAISLAKNIEECEIVATDLSSRALDMAKRNAEIHQVSEKISFLKGNLFTVMNQCRKMHWTTFDLIVSNPPYIKTGELDALQEEIHFEPKGALDGGLDGLSVMKPLISQAGDFLGRGGFLFMEMGYDQSKNVGRIVRESGFKECEIVRDYSGIERVFIAKIGRKNG